MPYTLSVIIKSSKLIALTKIGLDYHIFINERQLLTRRSRINMVGKIF